MNKLKDIILTHFPLYHSWYSSVHQGALSRERRQFAQFSLKTRYKKILNHYSHAIVSLARTNRTCSRLLQKNQVCPDRAFASDTAYAEIRFATQALRSSEKRLWRRTLGVLRNIRSWQAP